LTSRGRKSAPSARTSLHPRFKLDSCATPLRQTETFQSTVCASSQGLWETCAMNASSHPTAFEHTLYQPQTRARLGTTGQVRPAVEGRARHPRQPASSPDSGHEQGACTLHLVCVCVCVRVCVWVGGWGGGGWGGGGGGGGGGPPPPPPGGGCGGGGCMCVCMYMCVSAEPASPPGSGYEQGIPQTLT
jgi:hypothetical protein